MNKICFISALLATTIFKVSAQSWDVPEDKKARISPFKFTTTTVTKGEDIFKRTCVSCHGEPTKGNFLPLVPIPGDPATDKFQKQSDGALFYKMTTGRGPMPTFKDILAEEERWDIISYFRSFNKAYVQPNIESGKQTSAQQAILTVSYDSTEKQLLVLVTDTMKVPLNGAAITVFVKRYFGNMPVGEPSTSNEKGVATFNIPEDIPGDKKGTVELVVKLNSEKGGDLQKSIKLAIGVPTNKPSLTEKRAMWNIGIKAPIWLLLAYTFVVVGIWGFLVYIIIQMVKLRKSKN